jgi:glycosyltransferase involved in cell wall biosynthesis
MAEPPLRPRPKPRRLSIVIPLYNEEEVFDELRKRLTGLIDGVGGDAEVILVNDGSRDGTQVCIESWAASDRRIRALCFARNFGHQVAVTAGLEHAAGDAVVIMDADLQDPPELIREMVQRYEDGYDIVYGQRVEREGETVFKRWSAFVFYRLMRWLVHPDLPADTGDFRLMSRAAVDALLQMPEKHRFLRGMVAWLGFAQTAVKFTRPGRHAGQTKYNLRKMITLAWNASVSFSPLPLRLSLVAGLFVALFGACYGIYSILRALIVRDTVPGWTTLVVLVCLIGGWILISIGVLGEYVAKIFEETKRRPLYVVAKKINLDGKDD